MRSRLALGTLFVATTVSLTATVTGLAGLTGELPGTGRVGLFTAPRAAAAELVPFEGCDELLQWYVDQALPEVGPYGLGPGPVYPMEDMGQLRRGLPMPTAVSGSAATTEDTTQPVSSSGTGTNVQEAGVDEPDRAKTDGDVVVHVQGGRLVVTDVTGSQPREVGSLRLPGNLSAPELLLSGDTVLVVGVDGLVGGWGGPMPTDVAVDWGYAPPVDPRSRLLEVSLTDPAEPRVVSDQTFGGTLLSTRQYDDTIRLVLSTAGPVLDFVQPNRERTRNEAIEENRRILLASRIEDWLPTVRNGDAASEPLLGCADVRHPGTDTGYGTISVVTLDAADPTDLDSLGVTTSGETVYSSADRLYLATFGEKNTTDVHAFAIDGPSTSYVASGTVPGVLPDRWSMDEHDGVLRLALAHGPGWSPNENGITTVREQGSRLEVVGSVKGLGRDEQIKSVRWFDDLAVLVTFRQTDPLYTVDLSDPEHPRALGELKIPGFSDYLHPIGDERLLGLGQDAGAQGQTRGGQVSLFDVSDLARPERLGTAALGRHAYPAAAGDPRTFTWLPDADAGLLVVADQWTGRSTLVEVRVTAEGALLLAGSWPLDRWDAGMARALPLPGGTSVAVVTDAVRIVDLPLR